MTESAADALESRRAVLRFALFGLLIVSPLPFGSNVPWAVLLVQIYAALLGALAWIVWRTDPSVLTTKARHVLLPVVAILVVGSVQLVPLPADWVGPLAAPTAEARQSVGAIVAGLWTSWLPLSLEPPATLDALLRLTAYGLVGISAAVAIRSGAHLRQCFVVIAVSGAFQAIYGAAEYLSGHQHIFWYAKTVFEDEASGTFVNRNHFAVYLICTLPLALALALRGGAADPERSGWRDRFLQMIRIGGLTRLGGAIAAGVIWAGVILSYSRAGLLGALLVTGVVAVFGPRRARRARWLAPVLVVPLVWFLWQGVRTPGERFFGDEQPVLSHLGGRVEVWQATLPMIPDYPVLGSGLGTFQDAFLLYRTPGTRKFWDHAHNDWLQSATEGGLLVVASVLGVLGLALWDLVRRRQSIVSRPTQTACVVASLAGVVLLSVVDFGLRIPAIAVVSAVIIGLLCSAPLQVHAIDPRTVLRMDRNRD